MANYKIDKSNYCFDCTKKTVGKKYCQECYLKNHNPFSSLKPKQRSNGNFKHGNTLKEAFCIDCEKKLSKHAYYYGYKRCTKCDNIHREEIYQGAGNPNYTNGKSKEPYSLEFNKSLKEKIHQRDNYICQKCDITEEEHIIVYGKKLSVHHIDYNKQNCDKDNLITLCNECNIRVNYNRDYWQKYFTKLMENKLCLPITS